MWETWLQSLGWEDPLEKGKATQSSILAWRIWWTDLSIGSQRDGHNWVTFTSLFHMVSLVAQMIKNLPAMQDTWVWSLGQEDLLEKEMANHSSILAWKILWTEEPVGLQSMWSQRDTTEQVTLSFSLYVHILNIYFIRVFLCLVYSTFLRLFIIEIIKN